MGNSVKLALTFDFDETLAPDSTSALIQRAGVDPQAFWAVTVGERIRQGWDPVMAYLYELKRLGEAQGRPFRRGDFEEVGRGLTLHPGVESFFDAIRNDLADAVPNAQLDFYLISSGIGDLVRSTPIAQHFTDIWSCEWHYGADGAIEFPSRVVSFTDKTRYVYQISKGLVGPDYRNRPYDVNLKVSSYAVPMNRIVFVGDGLTDVAVFSLLSSRGGVCYAVYDPDRGDFSKAWSFLKDERVKGLYRPIYHPQADLYHALLNTLIQLAREATS